MVNRFQPLKRPKIATQIFVVFGKTAVKDAFANGDKIVGGSLYQLDDGWDTGQVLLQQSVAVDDDDTLTSLWQGKLAPLGVGLFKEYLSGLLNTI